MIAHALRPTPAGSHATKPPAGERVAQPRRAPQAKERTPHARLSCEWIGARRLAARSPQPELMADAEPPADRKKGRRLLGAARNLTAAMSQKCLVVEWLRCLCWWTAQPKHCETLIIIIITEVGLGWRSKWSPPSACSQVALDRAARTSLINLTTQPLLFVFLLCFYVTISNEP